MSVFKTTFSRALKVIPTDNANIPYPNIINSGVSTGQDTNQLIDSGADFVVDNISAGDIVYNTSNNFAATVVEVINENTLLLNADIIPSSATIYSIYNASPQSSNGVQGCSLYLGTAGNVKVTTIGQDIVTFNDLKGGTILPVQVVKVHSYDSETTVTSIIALW